MSQNSGNIPLNPAALPLPEASKLLTRVSGYSITPDMLQADIAAGAPVNADGTLHLLQLTAWLVQQLATNHDDT